MRILNGIKFSLFAFKPNFLFNVKFVRSNFSIIKSETNVPCLKEYKLETPLFQKNLTPELVKLADIFAQYKYELRIAGGAVRDLLMNIEPHDVDLATNALPQQMVDMLTKENVRIFNLNGMKHGTVTVRVNDKVFHLLENYSGKFKNEFNE